MNVGDCVLAVRDVPGDFAEFGVFEGKYTFLLAEHGRTVWAWDTFEGMPDDDYIEELDKSDPPGKWKPEFDVLKRMAGVSNIVPIVGKFSETIPAFNHPDVRFALVHVDCDHYHAHLRVLDFIGPRMSPGGIVQFDDYDNCAGAKKAIDEWCVANGRTYNYGTKQIRF